jgi:tRNA(His) guanylyltransferase
MTTTRRDALGDRMKRYEEATRFILPRRTYTILRVDGRAFHSWTRGLLKPYDTEFMRLMDVAAITLCSSIPGAQFAYVQSDEISVLAVDFDKEDTQSWFDGNVQKWASIGAAVTTMAFNLGLMQLKGLNRNENEIPITKKSPNAVFDARVFIIPDPIEVENYFVWRQQDAERNSVMMLARAYASHKELAGKKRADQHEIIHKAGDNWAKHPVRFKHGAVICRFATLISRDKENEKFTNPRSSWVVDENTPVFTKDRAYLRNLVPIIWNDDLLVRKAAANG